MSFAANRVILIQWLFAIGAMLIVAGVAIEFNLDRLVEQKVDLVTLNAAATAGYGLPIIGALLGLTGAILWAYDAPLSSLTVAGVSAGASAFLLVVMGSINVHGPTVVFLFIALGAGLGCGLLLLIAAIRFAMSKRKHSHFR